MAGRGQMRTVGLRKADFSPFRGGLEMTLVLHWVSFSATWEALTSNTAGSFEDADGSSADARHELFAQFHDQRFEMAGAAHFHALENVQGFSWGEFSAAHEISAERAGGGSCGRV